MAVFTMVLYSIFLFLAVILKGQLVSSLQCYRCAVLPSSKPENSTQCVNFDYSQVYEVDCPYSTMCMKRKFEYTLLDGVQITGVERDCAPQKNEYNKFNETIYEWIKVSQVDEKYEEGCQETDDYGLKSVTTVYCYCRGQLCNNANKNTDSYHSDTMGVILIFNLLKYIKSLT